MARCDAWSIYTERVEVRIIEHATGLLRTAHDRKRRGCITHPLMSLQGSAHKSPSFAKPGWPTNSAILLIITLEKWPCSPRRCFCQRIPTGIPTGMSVFVGISAQHLVSSICGLPHSPHTGKNTITDASSRMYPKYKGVLLVPWSSSLGLSTLRVSLHVSE